jgi:hypothetical protein
MKTQFQFVAPAVCAIVLYLFICCFRWLRVHCRPQTPGSLSVYYGNPAIVGFDCLLLLCSKEAALFAGVAASAAV